MLQNIFPTKNSVETKRDVVFLEHKQSSDRDKIIKFKFLEHEEQGDGTNEPEGEWKINPLNHTESTLVKLNESEESGSEYVSFSDGNFIRLTIHQVSMA